MLLRLFIPFALVSFGELYLLFLAVQHIGIGPVLAIVAGTALAGFYVASRQGITTIRRVAEDVGQGKFPGATLVDGAMTVTGGILLILPGFCADALGLLMILPPTRYLIKLMFRLWLNRRFSRRYGTVTVYR